MTHAHWTRRGLVAAALAVGVAPTAKATPGGARCVAIDWGWASTLVALGITPAGVAEQRGYADWVRTPALPAGVPDVGLRGSPSLETIAALEPDLILTNALNANMQARLQAIAPTLDNPTFTSAKTPLANAAVAARLLGDWLGRGAEATALIADADARIARARARLPLRPHRPLLAGQMVDLRHLTIYGQGSLFHDVLVALGLRNAYAGPTSQWGHATRAIADLPELLPADILLIAPLPSGIDGLLAGPSFLASLLAQRDGRVYRLPPAWIYGDLTSAARFAELVADALTDGGAGVTASLTSRRPAWRLGAAGLAGCLAALAVAFVVWRLGRQLSPGLWLAAALDPAPNDVAQLAVHYSTLPRLAIAALAGAALAASGTIFQHVLHNPLASPVTLGISAGAQLALVAATVFAPAVLAPASDLVALAGGLATMGVVLVIAAAQRFSSLALILAGLAVGLFCGVLAHALRLFNGEYLGEILLWSAGAIDQNDWSAVVTLVPRLAVLALLTVGLLQPLRLLGFADESARGLGLSLTLFRLATLAVGVAFAAVVTATVGMVSFVEIAAPLIARLAGARRFESRLVVAPVIGAALLVVVDCVVEAGNTRFDASLPTGAATAFLGAPLLLWLLPRLRATVGAPAEWRHAAVPRGRAARVLFALALLAGLAVLIACAVGRPAGSWTLVSLANGTSLLPFRVPRTTEAFAAGAMLATAGALLQRATGNPLASPEILGVGAAVMAGLALALLAISTPAAPTLFAAGALGAFLLLAILFWSGLRARFAPEQLLLTGVALTAALDAIVIAFLAVNDGRAAVLLGWMAGSTASADPMAAAVLLALAVVLIPPCLLLSRSLDLLPLGDGVASGLGVTLGRTRAAIMALAALLTAAAVLAVGPLTFVGLLGPHLARRFGLARSLVHLPGAALTGGLSMVLADWIGRVAIAPFEIPAGLVAALIGCPYLIVQLRRR